MRNCPRCLNTAVIEDGYCGHCRECTMQALPVKRGTDSQQRMFRHRSYDEACRDATASPGERENALLTEHVSAVREIEWLWATCKIVYWPKNDRYPIEHNPPARKYSRELIEAEMPNAEVIEGGTRDSRIATAAQSRTSLY